MPRVRTRKFDWREAQRLRAEGRTYTWIADRFGVSSTAVAYACDEKQRLRAHQTHKEWQSRGVCPDCGGPATRYGVGRQARCQACFNLRQATSVRGEELQCLTCREWKPDTAFPRNRSEKMRRGRHGVCRACQAPMRQQARERRRIPCVKCGKPRLHPNDSGSGKTGLCRACYVAVMAA
jgi:hypothetical protein